MPPQDEPEGAESSGTAARILDALVDVILDGGLPGFSVQEVADRAGVSHRTVYRHFPTREALLVGLSNAVEDRMRARGGVDSFDDLDELPDAVRTNFALFSHDRRATEAGVRFGVGAALELADRHRRTKMFQAAVHDALPELSVRDAAIAGAVLRQLASSRNWLGLTTEAGLDADDAARGAAWAAATIIDALRTGWRPSEPRGQFGDDGRGTDGSADLT